MCGRYATTRSAVDLAALFDAVDETEGVLTPDYNVAPTDPVPIVRNVPQRRLSVARWGLLPAWAEAPKRAAPAAEGPERAAPAAEGAERAAPGAEGPERAAPAAGGRRGTPARGRPSRINARAETVATNSAFAAAFRRHRCLVPADGWYEWCRTGDGRGKQPYFMTPGDGGVLVFAGLCATSSTGVLTCCVLTTAALGELAGVHDRMPLMLPPARWERWLSGPDPQDLLAPPSEKFLAALEIRPVGPAVGNVRNDGPHLIDPVPVTPLSNFDVQPTDLTLF
jgi:putative SOS response-associated peptidase YedK